MSSVLKIRPLRRSEFDLLVEDGVFDDERIELLEGALVEMSPEGAPHAWICQELTRWLGRNLPQKLTLRVGNPLAASEISEPQPDFSIVPRADYRTEHPSQALALIEVSRTSRAKDLGVKARIYGAAGVPLYWVIDVAREVTHVHTGPNQAGYASIDQVPFDATLDLVGLRVTLSEILEPPA